MICASHGSGCHLCHHHHFVLWQNLEWYDTGTSLPRSSQKMLNTGSSSRKQAAVEQLSNQTQVTDTDLHLQTQFGED